jgi:hypothetical protein
LEVGEKYDSGGATTFTPSSAEPGHSQEVGLEMSAERVPANVGRSMKREAGDG